MRKERNAESEQQQIARTPLEIERVRAILSYIIQNGGRADSKEAAGGSYVCDWLLGDDEALEQLFGISSDMWEQSDGQEEDNTQRPSNAAA